MSKLGKAWRKASPLKKAGIIAGSVAAAVTSPMWAPAVGGAIASGASAAGHGLMAAGRWAAGSGKALAKNGEGGASTTGGGGFGGMMKSVGKYALSQPSHAPEVQQDEELQPIGSDFESQWQGPRFARGGTFTHRQHRALVGEDGPEVLTRRSNGDVQVTPVSGQGGVSVGGGESPVLRHPLAQSSFARREPDFGPGPAPRTADEMGPLSDYGAPDEPQLEEMDRETDIPHGFWNRVGSTMGATPVHGTVDLSGEQKGYQKGLMAALGLLGVAANYKASEGKAKVDETKLANERVVNENKAKLQRNELEQRSYRTGMQAARRSRQASFDARRRAEQNNTEQADREYERRQHEDERFRQTHHKLPNGQWVTNSDPSTRNSDGTSSSPDTSDIWKQDVDAGEEGYRRAKDEAVFDYRLSRAPNHDPMLMSNNMPAPSDSLTAWDNRPGHPMHEAKTRLERSRVLYGLRTAKTLDAARQAGRRAKELGLENDPDVDAAAQAAAARLGAR